MSSQGRLRMRVKSEEGLWRRLEKSRGSQGTGVEGGRRQDDLELEMELAGQMTRKRDGNR